MAAPVTPIRPDLQVIPMTEEQAKPMRTPPQCSVLTTELSEKLCSVNALDRALREVGIEVLARAVLDRTLLIRADHLPLLNKHFLREMRCLSTRAMDQHQSRHVVRLRGVDVSWITPAREQGQ